jgi:TetR/AcrR family transcriptional regulator
VSESRDKIIEAAIELFAEKGKHGVRMEEVGARAGVNKAMVYYYFSTKENLYKEAVQKTQIAHFAFMAEKIDFIAAQNSSPKEKLVEIIKSHFGVVSSNRNYTKILFNALANNPEYIHEAMMQTLKEPHLKIHQTFEQILKDGIEAKVFREVDLLQTQISIIGINLIYSIGKSMGQAIFDCPCDEDSEFHENRLNSVIDLVLFGILRNPGNAK